VVEAVAKDAPDEDRALVGRFTGLSFTVQDSEAKHREVRAVHCRRQRKRGRRLTLALGRAMPDPSLQRSADGRPPARASGRRQAVHSRQPGPGVLPSSPA
jgi:hypothetical protein